MKTRNKKIHELLTDFTKSQKLKIIEKSWELQSSPAWLENVCEEVGLVTVDDIKIISMREAIRILGYSKELRTLQTRSEFIQELADYLKTFPENCSNYHICDMLMYRIEKHFDILFRDDNEE